MRAKSFFLAVALLSATAYTGKGQPTLQFSASSYTVAESAGIVTLIVQRTGDTNNAVSVDYATVDGTATNGLKYTATNGTLAFGAGETNKAISVPILDEGLVVGTRTFRVILSNPVGDAILGMPTNATVSIRDNDVGTQFQYATYSVPEDADAVMLAIVRGDDGNLPVTVDFATTDLGPIGGVDYTGTTNPLSFAAQERLKFVTIPILNNLLKQSNRSFRATLSNPVGVSLGSQKITTVTIVDNDQGFKFDAASYTIAEDAGAARIGVLRGTDDTNSTVTVDVATSDFTASNGVAYSGITNTLTFAPGERFKQVSVAILNDGTKQSTRSFRVTLSNPTGGAVLGSPTTVTVNILDNDPGLGFERTSYSVWENAGAITLAIVRGNDFPLGPVTADYATSDGTAKAGTDYQAVSNTLVFSDNETVKAITIPILRNGAITNSTNFRVTLSNPTGGATLGLASTLVVIQDATGLGTFRPVSPPFATALSIRREGDLNILTWSGGGQLQRADNPAGPWQVLTTATNPYTVQSLVPTTFYRVARPRPVNVYVPSSYDDQTPMPLFILLHGYGFNGVVVEDYMRFRPMAEARGFLYCYPESTTDQWGTEFWNATDFCCDFAGSGVDDAGYLRTLIEEVGSQFTVDRKRVHLIGHSNGGCMAYRMACQSADVIAGIASLAGPMFSDTNRCQPSQPVNILHIHGTADASFVYPGGAFQFSQNGKNMPAFAGALQTVQTWANYNGAHDPVTDSAPSMDLDLDVPGLDSVITRYTNAPPGGAVELWTVNGGSHVPTLYTNGASSDFAPRVIDWLLAHPKP